MGIVTLVSEVHATYMNVRYSDYFVYPCREHEAGSDGICVWSNVRSND
jgi:hypothetical protein